MQQLYRFSLSENRKKAAIRSFVNINITLFVVMGGLFIVSPACRHLVSLLAFLVLTWIALRKRGSVVSTPERSLRITRSKTFGCCFSVRRMVVVGGVVFCHLSSITNSYTSYFNKKPLCIRVPAAGSLWAEFLSILLSEMCPRKLRISSIC